MCDLTSALPNTPPSPWVVQNCPRIIPAGRVLDLAAGGGRHTYFLRQRGHPVVAIDRDTSNLCAIAAMPGPELEILAADLEEGSPWPLPGRHFAGIVVTNYLHRPILPRLVEALLPGGVLIYETFAQGNERFGRPSNPDFLLAPGELLGLAQRSGLAVLGYFSGEVLQPKPAVVQRIAAIAPI